MEKTYSLPCCCVQDGGVVKSIRDPHASQAIVSISTLIQPLLAQLTALIACQRTKTLQYKIYNMAEWRQFSVQID